MSAAKPAMVKRYSLGSFGTALQSWPSMREVEDGTYVTHADYTAVTKRLDELLYEVIQVAGLLPGNGDLAELLASRLRAAMEKAQS